jgi:hypothetical protein
MPALDRLIVILWLRQVAMFLFCHKYVPAISWFSGRWFQATFWSGHENLFTVSTFQTTIVRKLYRHASHTDSEPLTLNQLASHTYLVFIFTMKHV